MFHAGTLLAPFGRSHPKHSVCICTFNHAALCQCGSLDACVDLGCLGWKLCFGEWSENVSVGVSHLTLATEWRSLLSLLLQNGSLEWCRTTTHINQWLPQSLRVVLSLCCGVQKPVIATHTYNCVITCAHLLTIN